MAIHKQLLRTPQNETVYVLNKLYRQLNREDQLMIQRERPEHLFWLLQLLFQYHFQCTFYQVGPFKSTSERDSFLGELREFAALHGMQSGWNVDAIAQGAADSLFLAFLKQVLGFLEDTGQQPER